MSLQRLWLAVLILIAVISVSINAFILSALTDKYFTDYRIENYENHFNEIVDYSKTSLLSQNLSVKQMAVELETHLDDPIVRIKLYDDEGNLLVDVSDSSFNMMGRNMMDMMLSQYDEADRETDHVEIINNGITIGLLNITRYSSLEDSIVARRFKSSLLINSLYSIVIVLAISLMTGIFISRKMSKDLTSTARMAQDIALGEDAKAIDTNINEIRAIQQSLETLKNKLKLKSKSRKVLIDELVHQTRTPLTILKTHLEGFSDKILEMTPEEIKVCDNQIDNITDIISNMSNLIDAEKDFDVLNIEEVEIASLLKKIVNGLNTQFKKKGIKLNFNTGQKIVINTDKYKLSQAVYNILTNAYKYTEKNGTVNIRYSLEEMLSITIEDNGIGIRQEDLERIFTAYYRRDTGENSHGEGLGLYLAKENIEKMQGTISVSSTINKGSKFIIKVPLEPV